MRSVPGLLYHIQDTHHGCSPWMQRMSLDRGLDILTEDPEHTDLNNDNTHSLDATVAIIGPDVV